MDASPRPPADKPARARRVEPGKSYAEVALPTALRRSFTYAVPPSMRETIQIGHRVRVRFGQQTLAGYVVGFLRQRPKLPKIRPIGRIDPPDVLFTPEILDLTRWVADYYLAPWGQVLEGALPRTVRRGAQRPERKGAPASIGGSVDLDSGAESKGKSGRFEIHTLSSAQAAAVTAIRAALAARVHRTLLLHGVTGSGKTEVYLDAAETVVREGGGVLFLVPEIAMGTQILDRVRHRFGSQVGLYHSQAGEKTRREVWREAREGRLAVVVGARSAVFVPLPNLRLIVIDEEHENAYKQDEAPRYHGRDTAIYRAQVAGAVVVLGSATPSLESVHNAARGKYQVLRLDERVEDRPLSRVLVVDMSELIRSEKEAERAIRTSGSMKKPAGAALAGAPNGAPNVESTGEPADPRKDPVLRRVLSPLLQREIEERLDRGEQSILFLNRRGHSTAVQCSDCGETIQCPHCDVILTWHKGEGVLRCHYCGLSRSGVQSCAGCNGHRFFFGGFGTQRVEEALRLLFPSARLARMDQDATRRKGSHARLIEEMETGLIDILLGTQMVAKGFHFPRVTLVGVLQADREMMLPDFRASERAFQLLTQVSGRAGRGTIPGEVVFQTMTPQHYVIACAVDGNHAAFAERELLYREQFRYPPFHRIIHLLVDGPDPKKVEERARSLADLLLERIGAERYAIEVLGPAPMSLSRLKDQFRWHVTLKGRSSTALHRLAVQALDAKPPRGLTSVRVQADVDPMNML